MQVLVKNWLVDDEKTEVAHLWAAGCSQCVAQISVLPGTCAACTQHVESFLQNELVLKVSRFTS